MRLLVGSYNLIHDLYFLIFRYSDCVCPWVWTGKAPKCLYGDKLNASVAMANTLYLKGEPDLPEIEEALEPAIKFAKLIRNGPVMLEDVEELISGIISALGQVSNDDPAILLASYLKNLSPDFKSAMVDLIKEIQGEIMGVKTSCNPDS